MHVNRNEGEMRNYQLIVCKPSWKWPHWKRQAYGTLRKFTHDIAPEHSVSMVSGHIGSLSLNMEVSNSITTLRGLKPT